MVGTGYDNYSRDLALRGVVAPAQEAPDPVPAIANPVMEGPIKAAICIPTYNQAEFIGEAIESVLNQTYRDYDLYVVNGGCTDNTDEVVSKYKGLFYIKLPYCSQNEKLNMVFKFTKAPVCVPLASDDYLHPDFLAKTIAGIRNGADFVYVNMKIVQTGKGGQTGLDRIKDLKEFQKWGGYNKLLSGNNCGLFWAYRKTCFDKVGGYSELLFADWDFILKIVDAGFKVMHIPEGLGYYRRHAKAASSFCDWNKAIPYCEEVRERSRQRRANAKHIGSV